MQKIRPLIIFFILSLIIVLSWFKNGLYFGGAEVGLSPFYNPERYLNIQQFIWWHDVAPGALIPQFISAVPLYFVLSILQKLFSPLVLQGLLFFSLLFLMGYGMYLFAVYTFGKERKNYAILAGLFYMFNSYVLVEVWHRFLYTGIFLAAAIPIIALFWRKWVKEGRFIFLIIFLLINLAFSYMYGNLTSLITVWIMCFLVTITDLILPWQGRKYFLKTAYKFIIGFLLFLITNLWWLIPVLKISTEVLPTQHNSEDNISTLVNISKQTILPYTLQLANPFYLFDTAELGTIYKNLIFLTIPWLPIFIIFIGLLQSLKKSYLVGFGLAYLLVLLLSKGAAQPFGYPYIWGFINFYILGVLRNPFEKLGILLPFFGAILFAAGLESLSLYSKRKFGNFISKLLPSIILISILIYAFPMFTGRIFNKPDYPLAVSVPQSYKDADNWFKVQQNFQGNILHLPFPSRDVVTYDWENGYHGVEINEILFTSLPSITRNVGIKRVDDTLKSLSFIFTQPFSEDKNQILRLLQSLNVQYIILHKDTRWEDTSTYGKDIRLNNPQAIEETLNKLEFLEKNAIFGDLIIFKLKENFYLPKIVFSNNIDLVFPGESNIMQTLAFSKASSQLTPLDKNLDKVILDNASGIIIFPENILYNWEASVEVLENMLSQVIAAPNSPNSLFSQQIAIKQYFNQTGVLLSETLLGKTIEAGNNLIDLIKAKTTGDRSSIKSILDEYSNQIDAIFSKAFSGSSLQTQFKPIIAKVFTLHLYILESFSESAEAQDKLQALKSKDKLTNYLVSNDILPFYPLDKKDIQGEVKRRVHHFNIPINSSYELLMTDKNTLNLYPDILSKLNLLLDGKSIFLKRSETIDFISLGEIELSKGIHEISYNVFPSTNLAVSVEKFTHEGAVKLLDNQIVRLETNQQTGSVIKNTLEGVNGGDVYEVSFEGLFENPREFYLQIVEDVQSQSNPYDCFKVSCYLLKPNLQTAQWEAYSLILDPLNLATREASFQIILPTVNTGLPSSLEIRNLKINRIMDNNLVLRKKIPDQLISTPSAQLIEFKKISNVKYEGKIKLDKPSFMFFKETFNPGWVLKLFDRNNVYSIDKHYLGNLYGNFYYIDRVGNYDFRLEFEPQKFVDQGLILSVMSWLGILVVYLYIKFNHKL